jgi:hypothetical protein
MKQARSYERMIVLLVINENDNNGEGIPSIDVDQISRYQQVQSILIIHQNNKTNSNEKRSFFADAKDNVEKLFGIYSDYQSASDDVQNLLAEAEQLDDGSLTTFNKGEKSLKDVRQDFIEFFSTHSYRGEFIYFDTWRFSMSNEYKICVFFVFYSYYYDNALQIR